MKTIDQGCNECLSAADKRNLLHYAKYEMDWKYYLKYREDLEANLPLRRIFVFGDRMYERIQNDSNYSNAFMSKYFDVRYD